MKTVKTKHTKGFTLVELAIVLVIIGLIVASVLVGQDLIKSAELRATTKQYQEFQAAVNTFIGKYGAIPGDIASGTTTFGLGTGADAGDGDGLLTDSADAITLHDDEISDFWEHLTDDSTGYVAGTYDGDEGAASATVNDVVGENLPPMKFGSRGWGVFGVSGVNYFVTGVVGSQGDDAYDTADVFVPVDAFNIDDKIDDGVATTGNVVSRDGAVDTPNTVGAAGCNDTGTGVYTFSGTTATCNLRFRMTTF